MTSKITIGENKTRYKIKKGKPYISTVQGTVVVLATQSTSSERFPGTVIYLSPDKEVYELGMHHENWSAEIFEPFIGTIELKEEG